jgi:hypothetical protein
MEIGKTFYQLLKEVLSDILSKLAALSHVGQKVATSTKLHHKADVLAGLEGVIQADDALMI